jgi:hypothetical protein
VALQLKQIVVLLKMEHLKHFKRIKRYAVMVYFSLMDEDTNAVGHRHIILNMTPVVKAHLLTGKFLERQVFVDVEQQ